MLRRAGALLFAGVLAIAGCSGEDGDPGAQGLPGADGPQGPAGPAGEDLVATAKPESCVVCHAGAGAAHQAVYDQYTDESTLVAAIESVDSVALGTTPETYDVTVTFSLTKDGALYDTPVTSLSQKTVYVTQYDPSTRKFDPTAQLTLASLGAGLYEATGTSTFDVEASNAMVYAYFAEGTSLITKVPSRRYSLYDNLASVAQSFGTLDYESAVNVSACENCHGSPYLKHGYRAGAVAGIPDMAACKACHFDSKEGGHEDWQCLVDDPAAYAAGTCETKPEWADYAYVASTMNDTHMSHAMEFAYPQNMANCATCHAGKLDLVHTTANFTLATCKSCHPVTGVGGTDPKRAPALLDIIPAITAHNAARADLYGYTGACNGCHDGAYFAAMHPGYDALVYAADGSKYSSTITTAVDSATFDDATNVLTVNFSVAGADADAIIKPTVVVSLYGYDTKDFVVSGHGSQPDNTRNLEWAEGSTRNSARLTVTPATATAGNAAWVATADLSLWAAKLADGSVKKAEIGILPIIGLDQGTAPSTTTNPYLAVSGAAKTFDLAGNAVVADASVYGKAIVDTSKCNKCHEALGTTFHSPAYGAAGVVGCRLCHTGLSGGSHLEMQSRSIDSYVHAIHSMQPFDIGEVNFADPIEAMHYDHHVESVYPNFTILNCESCHFAGTYDVPDNSRSLPGLLSKADPILVVDGVVTWDRNVGAIPAYVTGPATRACGSCHRTQKINADDAAALVAFNEHTGTFGYLLEGTTEVLDAAIAKIMAFFE